MDICFYFPWMNTCSWIARSQRGYVWCLALVEADKRLFKVGFLLARPQEPVSCTLLILWGCYLHAHRSSSPCTPLTLLVLVVLISQVVIIFIMASFCLSTQLFVRCLAFFALFCFVSYFLKLHLWIQSILILTTSLPSTPFWNSLHICLPISHFFLF